MAKLDRLTKPVEYRVTAGELASPVYQIDIRRPLRIDEVKVELTPPSYTGQPTSTSLDLNLSVLQGTLAKDAIQFDKPVKSASLVFAPRKQPRDDEDKNEPVVVPLELGRGQKPEVRGQSGGAATSLTSAFIDLTLNEDRNYSIVAEAEDGTRLPESKYRIRVREDQPPQVTIEEPNDAVEVHTLAELLMRIRVRDDYGLAKAGVIFQINNEQEVPLISQDFETVVAAAQEAAQTGTVSPTTQAALEKVLPLEFFELTQKDSVMYFAFAEDNRPDQPQRTETDMQFIDIRPFKRTYQVFDPDPMNGMGMGTELKSLGELIQRQRFALNRTMQIEKRAASGRKPDATTLDQLMQFEKELAENVRDTAQGLEARGFDDTELFYQAETAMLAAVDSLSVGKWENATLQMKDALKALVEQRDRTRFAIMKNPDPARLAALRQFDRAQAQKLRRPKSDKEEARELIRRLEELMNQETSIDGALEDDVEKSEDRIQKSEVGDQKAETENT
ncbi:MAG: VWA domain-containing protein, partial [Candidatus Saccharimonas sp.]|nr:VWA domain-containing protein [Planctomycetaceae bacterium]